LKFNQHQTKARRSGIISLSIAELVLSQVERILCKLTIQLMLLLTAFAVIDMSADQVGSIPDGC